MVFSDSAANVLGDLSYPKAVSSIFVFNTNGTLIFKSSLKGLNIKKLNFYSIFSHSRKLRIKELDDVNLSDVRYTNGMFSLKDYFNNLYFYDLGKKNRGRIILDSMFIVNMYKAYYKTSFDTKFPVIQRAFNYRGRLKPEIYSYDLLQVKGKTEVCILYNIRDFDIVGKDTSLYINQLIYRYNLRTRNGAFYTKDISQRLLQGREMGVREIFYHDEKLNLFFFNKVGNLDIKPTFIGALNFSGDQFQIEDLHRNVAPADYIKKVGRMTYRNANVSNIGLLFSHADSLYLMDKKKQISIPLEERITKSNFNDLIWYKHYFSQHDSTYSIYYLRRKPLGNKVTRHLLQFDSNGSKLVDKSVEDYISEYGFNSIEFVHAFQIIGIDGKSNEIVFVDL